MSDEVIIAVYNPLWPTMFHDERKLILETIGSFVVKIEHIGSTAIPTLASKPIVDIMIAIRSLSDDEFCIHKLEHLQYEYVQEFEAELPTRRYFSKPPKDQGIRKYHVHMVEYKSEFWNRQLLFRDYLRTHNDSLKEYEKLKKKLAKKYRLNREDYTEGKGVFIQAILKKAKK
ncbi:MAG: GrpB family protein, partial [Candidatus Heimdallarchaeota archaeon]